MGIKPEAALFSEVKWVIKGWHLIKKQSNYRQFEWAVECNGFTNQEKVTAWILALIGKVLEILQTILDDKQHSRTLEIKYGNHYLK